MSLVEFLSVFSIFSSLYGAVLLVVSEIRLTPRTIARLSITYFDYNKERMSSLISMKIDFMHGAMFVGLVFFAQISNLTIHPNFSITLLSYWQAFGLAAGIPTVLLIIGRILRNRSAAWLEKSTRKSIAREFLVSDLRRLKTDFDVRRLSSCSGILNIIENKAQQICNVKRINGQSSVDFLIDYASYLGVDIPTGIDLDILRKTQRLLKQNDQ